MNSRLMETAAILKQPDEASANEFSKNRTKMVALGNKRMTERADMEKLVGADNLNMALDNNTNFARFMESMFFDYNHEVFVDTVLWVFRAYRSHGFKTTYWPANLNTWVELLKTELSPKTFEAIYPFYNWLIVNIPIFVKLTENTEVKSSES